MSGWRKLDLIHTMCIVALGILGVLREPHFYTHENHFELQLLPSCGENVHHVFGTILGISSLLKAFHTNRLIVCDSNLFPICKTNNLTHSNITISGRAILS